MTPVAPPIDRAADGEERARVRDGHGRVAAPPFSPPLVDERAARAELRRQIGKLERSLSQAVFEGPVVAEAARTPVAVGSSGAAAMPRILSLAELERLRDELVARVDAVHQTAAAEAERHAEARRLLEAMRADPSAHRWVILRDRDLGLPGCTAYHVRPRLGPIGMLMNWWRVKVSSGCPLAGRQPLPRVAAARVSPARAAPS
jgi:hypothetical protein